MLLDQQTLDIHPILTPSGDDLLDDQIFRRADPDLPSAQIALHRAGDDILLVTWECQQEIDDHALDLDGHDQQIRLDVLSG